MVPNHAPLVVAEQLGTLEALHPGRIDLGIGRAPGTNQATALALRRTDLTGCPRRARSNCALVRIDCRADGPGLRRLPGQA
jgi:alkanesulfonate monooxygenase SsuD/methylene tetrahydromethanopterin reductase-like flavin-dependent oxidoreductase (luciferase family)